MGTMVHYSLLWVMQDLYHQSYYGPLTLGSLYTYYKPCLNPYRVPANLRSSRTG